MAVAVAAGLVSFGGSVDAAVPGYEGTQNVDDTMAREVTSGFGSAQVGGAYATWPSGKFSVAQEGRIAVLAPGTSAYARLAKVSTVDQRLQLVFSVPQIPAKGNGVYVGVELRRQAGGDLYRVQLRVAAGGRTSLVLLRVTGGVEYRLSPEVALPIVARSGQRIVLDGYVAGSADATVAGRAWLTGAAEPGWALTRTDSSKQQIITPGHVGLKAYLSSGSPATALTVKGLSGWKLAPVGRATPTPTPPSTTTSSSTAAPTTTPPTTTTASPTTTTTASPTTTTASPTTTTASPTTSTTPAPTTSTAPPTTTTPAPPPPDPGPGGEGDIGSVPVGQANYPVPGGALFVSSSSGSDSGSGTQQSPLRSAQKAIDRAGTGQTIVLRGGAYHEEIVVSSGKNVVVQSYPGEAAWFDGSVPVSSTNRSGNTWVVTNWTAQFDDSQSFSKGTNRSGFVNPAYPMAAHPDQVFVNGVQLSQVATGVTPAPGQFAVDYGRKTLTLGTNPAGQDVRASTLDQAFIVGGTITLRGVGVHRYATSLPQVGTIYLGGKQGGSRIENVVVEDNATQGISISTKSVVVDRVTARNNGMVGIHGAYADNSLVQNSLVTGNNTQHFNSAPSAGGIKITRARGVTITHNVVKDNIEVNGIWLDESVVGFEISDNLVVATRYGILTELSDTGIVAGNDVSGAKYGYTAFNTGNVKVFNNKFSSNTVWDVGLTQDKRRQADLSAIGRDPRFGPGDKSNPWTVRNITVANNIFANSAGGKNYGFQFYGLDKETKVPLDQMNVTVDGNLFTGPAPNQAPSMAGWGGGDNKTVTVFDHPNELSQAKNRSWTNALTTVQAPDPQKVIDVAAVAVPVPPDVAKAIDVPPGSLVIGP